MKFNQIPVQGFLGEDGAVEHSYVLINYAEGENDTPITKQVTVKELGEAVANQLGIIMNDAQDGPVYYTVEEDSSTYTANTLSLGGNGDGGDFDPTSAIEVSLSDSSANTLPVLYESTAGAYYVATGNSEGKITVTSTIVTGNNPVIVYDSIYQAFGYYAAAGGSFNEVSFGGFDASEYTTEIGESQIVFINSYNKLYRKVDNYDSWSWQPLDTIPYLSGSTEDAALEWNHGNSDLNLSTVAHIGESDNRPAIYDNSETFIGFLSTN